MPDSVVCGVFCVNKFDFLLLKRCVVLFLLVAGISASARGSLRCPCWLVWVCLFWRAWHLVHVSAQHPSPCRVNQSPVDRLRLAGEEWPLTLE